MTVATQVPPRDAVPTKQTWNAESVFESLDAWQQAYETLNEQLPQLEQYAGKLAESPDTLAAYFELASQLRRQLNKLSFYASMRNSVNSFDTKAKSLIGQVTGLYGRFKKYSAFANPELLAIGEAKLLQWIRENDRLKSYEHMIEDLFRSQQYVLSKEVEEILGMVSEPFNAAGQIVDELTGTDLSFDDAIDSEGQAFNITQSSIDMAKSHPDREVRRTGWQHYADSYLAHKNTLASAYIASVKQSTFYMRVRGYESVLQMQLQPHNLPLAVFHNLIETYKKNLPTWHRYWDVKRRVLGLDKIYPYDIWAPMTDKQPSVSFEQAVDWICAGMAPLGDDYVSIMRKGCLEDRWVDWAVNTGKRQGAFSGGSYDTAPFIMMSFDHLLGGMSTLAHELGHSMHSYFSRKHQAEHDANYSMFVAETASNFNQAMTRAHLFETHNDRDFQLALIQEAMDNFHRYFFIMPTLARFEYEVHERVAAGKPLTADILNDLMSNLYAEGYGDTMSDDPERTGITWAQFGHLYVPFYTFQYATGISAANALADKVRSGDAQAVAQYRQFLNAGGSLYPLDALKIAGVDMTTPAAVEKAFEVLTGLVNRLEALIDG